MYTLAVSKSQGGAERQSAVHSQRTVTLWWCICVLLERGSRLPCSPRWARSTRSDHLTSLYSVTGVGGATAPSASVCACATRRKSLTAERAADAAAARQALVRQKLFACSQSVQIGSPRARRLSTSSTLTSHQPPVFELGAWRDTSLVRGSMPFMDELVAVPSRAFSDTATLCSEQHEQAVRRRPALAGLSRVGHYGYGFSAENATRESLAGVGHRVACDRVLVFSCS